MPSESLFLRRFDEKMYVVSNLKQSVISIVVVFFIFISTIITYIIAIGDSYITVTQTAIIIIIINNIIATYIIIDFNLTFQSWWLLL